MEIELVIKIAMLIMAGILALFIGACKKKPEPPLPDPDPEPEPVPKPKWSDYYPKGWYVPTIDWGNKWRERDFDSPEWLQYERVLVELFKATGRDLWNDAALSRILMTKLPDGRYLFKWTSDMAIWGVGDHWATPAEMLECRKDEKGNCDPNGLYRDDCDGFAGLNCDVLHRIIQYPLAWWIEIYWQRKANDVWRGSGHAITVYKREMEGNFRVFCNQSWVGMTNGYKSIEDIVYLYVPINNPDFKDNYNLRYVKARHPITGKLLWQVNGKDWG